MHIPEDPAALTGQLNPVLPTTESSALAKPTIDPDNPPWGVGMAILIWAASVLLLFVSSLVFLFGYSAERGITPGMPDYNKVLVSFALKDPTALFVQVLSTLPAHLLTLLVVWAAVTGLGKRPFWETLGWGWGRYFNLWSSIAVGLVLFAASTGLAKLLGGDTPTELEHILNSSAAAKYTIAFLATFTAPLVEECVYRGVVYSGLRRSVGSVAAVILVVVLFALVHVPQYRANVGVIAAVALLSLGLTVIRAVTGKLLPCFVVHLVFNGVQAVLIVIGASGTQPPAPADHGPAIIMTLVRSLTSFI